MNIGEQRDIIQAAIDGRPIQCRHFGDRFSGKYQWVNVTPMTFNFADFEYRIKPESLDLWLQYLGEGIYQRKFDGVGTHFREVIKES